MLKVIRADQRGHANHGWLDTHHTFSFANYYDPDRMGFRSLRVINEDRVAAGEGFGTHDHADMEILSYVVEGAIAHKDSTGTEEVLRPNEWQRMTAGTGISHSEYNFSKSEDLHFYQVWILPESKDLKPGYEQKLFTPDEKQGRLKLVASRDARDGSLKIHQDVSVYNSILLEGAELTHNLAEERFAWIQVVQGRLRVGDAILNSSDGAAVSGENALIFEGLDKATEFLLFDLA